MSFLPYFLSFLHWWLVKLRHKCVHLCRKTPITCVADNKYALPALSLVFDRYIAMYKQALAKTSLTFGGRKDRFRTMHKKKNIVFDVIEL